jgi:YVTN family beta-propeller protein
VIQKLSLDHAWLGVAWHPDGKRLYSSGAADNSIREVDWRGDRLVPGRTLTVQPPQATKDMTLINAGFMGGLAVSKDGSALYAAQVYGKAWSRSISPRAPCSRVGIWRPRRTRPCSRRRERALRPVWGGAKLAVLRPKTLEPVAEIAVGEHPNAMLFSQDGARLFVACANTNAVWVIDVAARRRSSRIGVALSPKAPPGSTPNALALSPDGKTLLVANADNNTIAVVDVTRAGESRFQGFIPTGWYPTGVAFDREGENVLVLSGKGLTSAANPRGPSRSPRARTPRTSPGC